MKHMTDWIMDNYPTSSGIIYCLTRKETSTIAEALYNQSHGQIRCGIYHSDLTDVSALPVDERDLKMFILLGRQGGNTSTMETGPYQGDRRNDCFWNGHQSLGYSIHHSPYPLEIRGRLLSRKWSCWSRWAKGRMHPVLQRTRW